MNILLIIVLLIFALSLYGGYNKGFLKTAFSLLSWIIVLVLCNYAAPIVTNELIEKTDIEIYIQSTIDMKLGEVISDTLEASSVEEIEAALPAEFKQMLLGENMSLQDAITTGVAMDTASLANAIVGIMGFGITIIALRAAMSLVSLMLTVIRKLPLIGPLDKMLGLACGAGEGCILSWLLLAAMSLEMFTGTNTEWASYIAQSEFLTWLQDNNLILNLIIANGNVL